MGMRWNVCIRTCSYLLECRIIGCMAHSAHSLPMKRTAYVLETKPVYSLSGPSREQGAEPQILEILLKRLSAACAIPPRSQGMTRIRKAVVAVAGSGTRFLPVTKAMPKEMLPIVDKPIIQLVAEEIVEAGIQDVIFVTKWDKRPLEDHFDPNWALTPELCTQTAWIRGSRSRRSGVIAR